MKSVPSILATGAVAFVLLTSGMVGAQAPQADGKSRALPGAQTRDRLSTAQQQIRTGFSNQLRPFYRYELMHVRTACRLSKEELRKIRPEADAAYEAVIAALAEARSWGRRSSGDGDPEYDAAIRKAVHSVVQRHVSRERWDAVQADLRLRSASRKQAGIEMLVALIDRELLLTDRQRRELTATIGANWEDRWCDAAEAGFGGRFRRPGPADGFVSDVLSASQREVWTRIPWLPERLWGVAYDHGGDAAMEQELGAVGPTRRVVRRPVVVAPQPRMVLQPAAPARVVELNARVAAPVVVMRQPAAVAGPAGPPSGDGEEPEGEPDPAVARQQQLLRERQQRLKTAYATLFDRRVFGDQRDEAAARAEAEAALGRRLDYFQRAGGLADGRMRKLRAAGQGDIKRFFDAFADERTKFEKVFDQQAPNGVRVDLSPALSLSKQWGPVRAAEGPIFTKAMDRTLNDDDRAALGKDEHDRRAFRLHADVQWTTVLLARSLGLTEDQRLRLEAVLGGRIVAPENFETSDYVIVMFQASRIPESEIRPIFDDLQWRVMAQELAAARRWELHLKRGGVLPGNMFGDPNDAVLPPIQLLAPPARPARR